ncbi:hypothetical protein A8C32_12780 [Flavivirga aquatica]|uniref:Uncharacterized protein n=1 Tax=Flavivirga aquatica TaxID=1849968 RepID=A0A1E5TDW5_9FLAO|nr:hypothetical protein [Flavivirga aquatica]OEK09572.1 hypothetical protein A8C32_12780 [Flavivirga aquatica]
MEDIVIINKNDFGIAFRWRRCSIEHHKKINFVFDKNALHLNEPEVLVFNKLIDKSFSRLIQNMNTTPFDNLVYVETPIPQLSLVLNYENLTHLKNLVEGTLLELGIDSAISDDKCILI